MFWIILISLIITLLLWVLLVPLMLVIDTRRSRYAAGLPGLAGVVALPRDGLFRLRIWILFVPLVVDPFAMKKREGRRPQKKRKKRKERSPRGMRLLRAVYRSGRIRRLDLDLDTDDFPLNAQLIPVFTALNRENINMRINFKGQLALKLDSRIRLGSVLFHYIRDQKTSLFI